MTKRKQSKSPLAPIFESPDDDELRRVIGDKLLEQNDPRGELIALQFAIAEKRAKPPEKKRAAEILEKHLAELLGPIHHVAHKQSCVFEKGFLVELHVDRRLVPREDWAAAARAEEWATVRKAELSVLTTPMWWLTEWMKNPAASKSLRGLGVSGIYLERDTTTAPWRVVKFAGRARYARILVALMQGMPAHERARLQLTVKAAKHKAMLEEAIAEAELR